MKRSWLVVLVTTAVAAAVAVMMAGSSSVEASEVSLDGLASVMASTAPPPDWLVTRVSTPVTLTSPTPHLLVLSNGLIQRSFTLSPDFGTVDYGSFSSGMSFLRGVRPEGTVTLDDTEYNVGALVQEQGFSGYFNRSGVLLGVNTTAWRYASHTTGAPTVTVPWTPGTRHSPKDVSWPPKGLRLDVTFKAPPSAPAAHQGVQIQLHYEMYEGLPLMSKWMTATLNSTAAPVLIRHAVVELLAVNQQFAPVPFGVYGYDTMQGSNVHPLYVMSDQAHSTLVSWGTDPLASGAAGASEPFLNCSYIQGPGLRLGGSGSPLEFHSFRALEMACESSDPERYGLCRRKLTRLLAPWTQENPIFFHLTPATDFKSAVDQLAQVGFEMIIFSFGSGFNLENPDPAYLKQIASDVAYAHSKGIEVGGYDLICLDRGYNGYGGNVGKQWDAVNPDGSLGANACFASGWYDKLHGLIFNFLNVTGLSMLETDGPYGGGGCAATNHSHHTGELDSVYMQTQLQAHLYSELRGRNVFINQPDNYWFQGGQKSGMGYDEYQYSLPRWQDVSVSRAGMYDDTFHYIPTQGWMFVPLVDYHSGGAAAAFEPLSEHLQSFEWALAQYLGAGVAACYRGNRIFDTPTVQAVVTKWVSFYKQYRDILISDIIHVRRADMQSIDCFMHANPFIANRGLAMVFNPTDSAIATNLTLPLYYTGISTTAQVTEQGQGKAMSITLSRSYDIVVPVNLPARGITWFLIQSGDDDQ